MDYLKLSIIIPAYNEEKTIQEVITRVNHNDYPCNYEIVVVNDSSQDKTLEKVLQLKSTIKNLKVISYNKQRGKGFAIKTGLEHAKGNWFIIQDADLEYPPEQIPKLLKLALEKNLEVVFGNRFSNRFLREEMKTSFYLGNKIISKVFSIIFRYNITDVETGCKLFSEKIKEGITLKLEDFGIEIELTGKIIKNKFQILEVPIEYNPRTKNQGKKITFLDGLKALYYILKIRLERINIEKDNLQN